MQLTPVITLNDTHAMLECALNGLGIVQLHYYLVKQAIISQHLVEVLNKFMKPSLRFMPIILKLSF